jgi:spermidine/putrescine transport system substrate-binding protein
MSDRSRRQLAPQEAIAFARGALTRRDLLRRAGAAGGLLAVPSLLAACGGDDTVGGAETTAPTSAATGFAREIAPEWTFANWPLYIDEDGKKHPSLDMFDAEMGTKTRYIEEINDNVEFFGKVQADLQAGNSIDRDIVVLSDWMAAKWIRLGYVMPLARDLLPNVDQNLLPKYRGRAIDENDQYLVPWQSGMTGIGYDPELTGFELTSVNDVFDPRLKGKVTMLTEMRDTFGLTMLGMGVDPANATIEDAQAAKDKLQQYVDNDHIRSFVGNNYQQGLATGDVAAAFAWSGDVIQLGKKFKFVIPDEGGMLWTDNMLIPQKAPHPYNAHSWMNFYYQPEIAAMVADYVWYVTPADGVQPILQEQKSDVADSPLVFPDPATLDTLSEFKALSAEEEQAFDELFLELTGG